MAPFQIAPESFHVFPCFFVSGSYETSDYLLSICVFTLLCDKSLLFPTSLLYVCVLREWNASQLGKIFKLEGMLKIIKSK